MMAARDRKTRKMRGSRSHGYGITQKHRGAGSRGGHGMAGSKKHKWSYVSKYLPNYFGKRGFTRPKSQVTKDETVNAGWLSENAERLTKEGKATKAGDTYTIDRKSVV